MFQKPDKGLWQGSCNRQACQASGAIHYNTSTRKYYCDPCAHFINRWARNDEGTNICFPVKDQQERDLVENGI